MSPRAGLDREAVVRVAADLVNADGLEALSLTHLAAQLGVQVPSLYNHVGGLPGLRRELALMGLREMGRRVTEAAVGRTGPEAVLAVAEAYRAYIKEAPGVYAAGLRASGVMPVVDEEQRAAEEVVLRVVVRIIQSFGLQGEDVIHAARGLRSLAHGFATLEISGGFGLPLDLDESYRRLIHLLILGMQRQSPSEPESNK